jgi:hypothetical protein
VAAVDDNAVDPGAGALFVVDPDRELFSACRIILAAV